MEPIRTARAITAAMKAAGPSWPPPEGVSCTEKPGNPFARATHQPGQRNPPTLTEFVEDGKITPAIDRGYPFDGIPAAVGYQEEGHSPGKVVITV